MVAREGGVGGGERVGDEERELQGWKGTPGRVADEAARRQITMRRRGVVLSKTKEEAITDGGMRRTNAGAGKDFLFADGNAF